ncbi:hypothetical protein APHNP_0646 [Anaplasma phagocytophilum str. ApNP]|uniref:Uncharacterized protein n=1 Tax=Anaplasma phagocytophilum str. ApNP TaxID=1359153 RepID=A0A0F3NG14_ANAPH|nr:hypothetical protein APHNP_0646 [Anaplasma phagocytophilum str. ApNP]
MRAHTQDLQLPELQIEREMWYISVKANTMSCTFFNKLHPDK